MALCFLSTEPEVPTSPNQFLSCLPQFTVPMVTSEPWARLKPQSEEFSKTMKTRVASLPSQGRKGQRLPPAQTWQRALWCMDQGRRRCLHKSPVLQLTSESVHLLLSACIYLIKTRSHPSPTSTFLNQSSLWPSRWTVRIQLSYHYCVSAADFHSK